jgi:hypothetical protein
MPYTVLFRNKSFESKERISCMPISRTTNPGIRIEESRRDPDFGIKTATALQKIKQGTSGKKLLDDISHYSSGGKRTVTIRDAGSRGPINTRSVPGSSSSSGGGFWPFAKSRASSASTQWSPDQGMPIESNGEVRLSGNPEESFVCLGHELVHAKNIMRGTDEGSRGSRTDPSTPAGIEEWRAIGLGDYYNRSPSENSIRAEHGLPPRTNSEQARRYEHNHSSNS